MTAPPRATAETADLPLERRARLAIADQFEDGIGHVGLARDDRPRVDEQIESVLAAHHADVADAVGIDDGSRCQLAVASNIRRIADDEDVLWRHPTAGDGDLPVRVVRREHEVGGPVRAMLEPARDGREDAGPRAARAPFRRRELRPDIVLVEHVVAALGAREAAEQPEQVRRVAPMDDVDAPARSAMEQPGGRE